ncbi:MAG: hypothetical protein KA746_11475 [Pyrinomonadaceae bacterium]|nr:hypothetical protein [Pyrinomonadaceae bacterium]MBP6213615.1 hypothetical protein [Pyrinomonadaceae bacterium]
MKLQFRIILTIAAIASTVFMIGCEQIDEANTLITASNKKVEEASTIFTKATTDAEALMSQEVEDLADWKSKNETKAKEVLANFDKATELYKAAAKDFDEAAKLKLNDKVKGYVTLKSKQLSKLSEYIAAQKGGIQAMLNAKDPAGFVAEVNAIKTKADALEKETDDLNNQVKKYEADNKDSIK